MLESCKNIECKVVRIAYDHGHKKAGLIKLYRDGVELPTARNIWVDFILINDETTPYHVDHLYEANGKAYDVIIKDDKGRCHYDGWKRREKQTAYAMKHGLEIPADTKELDAYREEERRRSEADAQSTSISLRGVLSDRARLRAHNFIRRHPEIYSKEADEFTDDELREVLSYMKEIYN